VAVHADLPEWPANGGHHVGVGEIHLELTCLRGTIRSSGAEGVAVMGIDVRKCHGAWSLVLSAALLIVFADRAAAQNLLDSVKDPGELELRARPITADNPMPSLIRGGAPTYPGEAAGTGAAGAVVFRITIDSAGTVAEARYLGHDRWAMREVKGRLEAAPMLDSIFVAASENTLRGWLFEPPVDGPVSLDVEFAFSGEGRTRTVSQQPAPADTPRPGPARLVTGPSLAVTHSDAMPISGVSPKRIKYVAPVYPADALGKHLEGAVIVELFIDDTGHVTDSRLVRSEAPFDEAALAAVRQWEFEPTLVSGSPTAVTVTVAVTFEVPTR
jgi:TonB family protein